MMLFGASLEHRFRQTLEAPIPLDDINAFVEEKVQVALAQELKTVQFLRKLAKLGSPVDARTEGSAEKLTGQLPDEAKHTPPASAQAAQIEAAKLAKEAQIEAAQLAKKAQIEAEKLAKETELLEKDKKDKKERKERKEKKEKKKEKKEKKEKKKEKKNKKTKKDETAREVAEAKKLAAAELEQEQTGEDWGDGGDTPEKPTTSVPDDESPDIVFSGSVSGWKRLADDNPNVTQQRIKRLKVPAEEPVEDSSDEDSDMTEADIQQRKRNKPNG
jgi:hypothetical protein